MRHGVFGSCRIGPAALKLNVEGCFGFFASPRRFAGSRFLLAMAMADAKITPEVLKEMRGFVMRGSHSGA